MLKLLQSLYLHHDRQSVSVFKSELQNDIMLLASLSAPVSQRLWRGDKNS